MTRSGSWLFAIGWMFIIFVVSSQAAPELATEPLFDFVLKKLAHAAAYSILTLLVVFGLSHRWLPAALWPAMIVTVRYAITDEIQTFVPTRNGAAIDVLIDATGAIGLLVFVGMHRLERSRQIG